MGFEPDYMQIDDPDLFADVYRNIGGLMAEMGARFRATAKGFALGSGNSIPDYVPVDGFMAMVEAAKRIRAEEL